ncbi:hypothetical protein MMAD_14220 [Mycolicibacterium madagascariense]|uniref:Uncharacterized protein n=1 Tax=Mycolicibacterium madagascariense TaxID=212765 RepID=A0A7I7XDS1_9MYCO|nr:hypothetical protein MMAD_14220 [Mycolicibacterium madagascariense]
MGGYHSVSWSAFMRVVQPPGPTIRLSDPQARLISLTLVLPPSHQSATVWCTWLPYAGTGQPGFVQPPSRRMMASR